MIARLAKRFDRYLAILGILVGIAAFFLSIKFQLKREHLGVAVILGACLYLGSKAAIGRKHVTSYRTPWYVVGSTIALFFIFLFLSETVVQYSLYSRPLSYVLLILGAVIICAIQIETCVGQPKLHWMETLILLEICLLSISIKAGAFFMYPDVSGNDPFLHERIVQTIISTGAIPASVYQSLPLMHLISAAFSIGTTLSAKFGLFYISILQSFVSLGVFFIGKGLYSAKTGLFAVLILSLSDYAIQWGVQIIPMTVGVALFTLILVSIFQRAYTQNKKDIRSWTIVLIFLCASIIVTHTLASLIVLVTLGILILGATLYRRTSPSKKWIEGSMIVLFGIGLFTFWMYAFSGPRLDFFSIVVKSIKIALTMADMGDVSSVTSAQNFQYSSLLLSEMGWAILLIFTVAGAIAAFTKRVRQPAGILITLLAGAFLAVTYGGAVIGAEAILPARWIIFLYLPSSVLAAYYLSKIIALKAWLLKVIGLLFIIAICFFMFTQPGRAMPDHPLYSAELSVRPSFYASELEGMEFVQQHTDSSCEVAASSKTTLYLYEAGRIDPREPETYQTAGVIVLRQFDYDKGIFIPYESQRISVYVPLTTDFVNYLTSSHVRRTYDNGSINVFSTAKCSFNP